MKLFKFNCLLIKGKIILKKIISLFFAWETNINLNNEVISTIVTAKVSDNLKRLFRYGILAKTKDSEASMKFSPNLIISKIHSLGTIHTTDFTNDMDYYQSLKVTRKGQLAA